MGQGAIDLGIAGLGPATPFGRGGFATVYRAEQLSLRREVAVKVLFAPPDDLVAYERFERECHSLGAVSHHPSIVVVHDRGLTDDGRPYLIMEFRAGGSLADLLATGGPLPAPRVRDVGIKIGEALAIAHAAGVIHRDVKPGNILLSAHGEPALADFGIARIDGGHKTATGQISASVAHAAREVLAGDGATVRSDVYSLGSTLFELATGTTPYHRPGDGSVWQLINRIMTEPPADAGALGVPEPLASVVQRALDPDPARRFSTARDLQAALRAAEPLGAPTATVAAGELAAGAVTVEAEPIPTAGLVPAAGPTGGSLDPTAAPDGRRPRTDSGPVRRPRLHRGRWVLAGIGLLLAVAAVALVAAETYRRTEPAVELDFSQALVEPLTTDRSYALGVDNAPPGSTYQLIVDDDPVGEPTDGIVVYRGTVGRHHVAVDVTDPDGSIARTNEVAVYVSPGPPESGFRVNLAAVRIDAANWPGALDRFDELVAEGHDDLVLSRGADDEYWVFYIDGFGDDSAAAWSYCDGFELEPSDCYAAEVPTDSDEPTEEG